MESNMYEINQAIDDLEHSIKYTDYLRTHHPDSLSRDSLRYYGPMSHTVPEYNLKTNAFEMFKNSGMMRLMNNRALLTDIWDLYADIDWLQRYMNRYSEEKRNAMNNDILLEMESKPLPYHARMYYFHLTHRAIGRKEVYEDRLRWLKEMIMEIEKELDSKH